MDLSIYEIIKGPVVTDKAYQLNRNLKKLVLRVHPAANKPMITEAIERLFNVKVRDVRVIVRKGKNRRVGRYVTTGVLTKKAIITLKDGYTVDLFNQQVGDQAGVVAEQQA